MSLVDEMVTRLKAECGDTFKLIERVAQMADIKVLPTAMPALYVYVVEEAAKENERVNEVYQRVEADIACMIITSNVGDPKGGRASSDVEILKKVIDDTLIGWQPASAAEAIEYVGGRLARANAGAVWWEHTLGAAFYKGEA
jgi:hypothetical protein